MSTLLTLQDARNSLLHIPRQLAMVVAPHGTTVPTKVTMDADGSLAHFPGFKPVGQLSKKGAAKIGADTKTNKIYGYGSKNPRETVVTEESWTLDATFQELRETTFSMWLDTDMSDVSADPTTGEWSILKKSADNITYWSVILIGMNGALGNEVYQYFIFPRMTVTKRGDWNFQDSEASEPMVSLEAYEDDVYGGLVRVGMAGKGNQAIVANAGFGTPTNEVQTIATTGTGTYKLRFNGKTTANLTAGTSDNTAIQAALEALPTIGTGNVTVTGASTPFTATFGGALANTNVPTLEAVNVAAGTTVTITTGTQGAP